MKTSNSPTPVEAESQGTAAKLNRWVRNPKLRTKLLGGFVLLSLVASVAAYVGNQLAFAGIEEDALPTQIIVAQSAELVRKIQSETQEFLASGEEATAQELDESIRQLDVLLAGESASYLGDDSDEAEIFENLFSRVKETSVLGQAALESRERTLILLDELKEIGTQADTLFESSRQLVRAEVLRNVQDGNLDELSNDAIPTQESLTEFIVTVRDLQHETLEYAAFGEAETLETIEMAGRRLEAARENLQELLEPDEPDEADLLGELDSTADKVQTKVRESVDAHGQTLSILEGLEDREQDLDEAITAAHSAASQDVERALATANSNLILSTLVTLLLATPLAFLITNTIVRPVDQLISAARQMGAGDVTVRAKVKARDEIGELANRFNEMAEQIGLHIAGLDQRVAERTRALAASTEVSRRLSTILDRDQLVREVVEQMQSAFGYYHTQIYLTDPAGKSLVMAGGTGEAGAVMMARGHSLPKGKGLVGRAAEINSVVLVSDTAANTEWLPNPLLPETKSELAVPIAAGEQVIGVLDVQHNVTGGLTQDDADLIQSVANQVAIALQNARSFALAQRQAQREQALRQITSAVRSSTDPATIMRTAVRELGSILGRKTVIQMATAEQVETAASNGEPLGLPVGSSPISVVGGKA